MVTIADADVATDGDAIADAIADTAPNDRVRPARPGYDADPDDNITLLASKIIRDVLVTRGAAVRRGELWRAVEIAMGERSPDVDGVLKRDWFNNQGTGPGRWELTEAAEAGVSPFTEPASDTVNLVTVVNYLRRCRGEAPYIGDVGDFIKICRPAIELNAGWLLQSGRALG